MTAGVTITIATCHDDGTVTARLWAVAPELADQIAAVYLGADPDMHAVHTVDHLRRAYDAAGGVVVEGAP